MTLSKMSRRSLERLLQQTKKTGGNRYGYKIWEIENEIKLNIETSKRLFK